MQNDLPILVVDDHAAMRAILRSQLKQLGYENVAEAADGGAALALLAERPFVLVISDWNMEPVGGAELLQRMRADGRFSDIPFIMMTSEVRRENIEAAARAGVSDTMLKPFNVETLKDKLESVFAVA